jgi:hypothetical protein
MKAEYQETKKFLDRAGVNKRPLTPTDYNKGMSPLGTPLVGHLSEKTFNIRKQDTYQNYLPEYLRHSAVNTIATNMENFFKRSVSPLSARNINLVLDAADKSQQPFVTKRMKAYKSEKSLDTLAKSRPKSPIDLEGEITMKDLSNKNFNSSPVSSPKNMKTPVSARYERLY